MLHDVARLPRQANLADRDIGTQFQAPGIDQRKIAPVPVRVAIETITGRAGHIFNDGNPLADHAVKKRGFADIWPAHDGDKWFHDWPFYPFLNATKKLEAYVK